MHLTFCLDLRLNRVVMNPCKIQNVYTNPKVYLGTVLVVAIGVGTM